MENITRHHMTPQCRVKNGTVPVDENPLMKDATIKMPEAKHLAWHILFDIMTWDEAIKWMLEEKSNAMQMVAKNRPKCDVMNETYYPSGNVY